jgi:hydrogenase maturation protein HypF
VAPRSADLGVLLPYSPLHHLLLADAGEPLVMTSGNVSDEPIAHEDDDALERLDAIADVVLLHDRPIHTRTDDSVLRAVPGRRPLLMRRSRGFVPDSLPLPVETRPLLACGAELKSTFCVAKGARAWVGHHIGDLKSFEVLQAYEAGIEHFERLFAVAPEIVAHDEHPDYLSTRSALARDGVETVAVQHHHAHLAACLAEHGETGRAAGAIYDGSGLGRDGAVWGGELLVGDLRDFERAGHLWPVRLPGGDRAVRQPWRMAVAWLLEAGWDGPLPGPDRRRAEQVAELVRTGLSSPLTTSMGRLFDAVAALCGLRDEVTYEGQAAVELEAVADPGETGVYEMPGLDARPTILAVAADVARGVDASLVSARFHNTVARATAQALTAAGEEVVVLSGGVFQNRRLLTGARDALEALGHRVLVPERLPPNDGGISYGQAAVAATRLTLTIE